MAKLIAWLVLVFVVLLALRIVNQRNARLRRRASGDQSAGAPAAAGAQPTVRCARCGIFLPRAEAKALSGDAFACADGQCANR